MTFKRKPIEIETAATVFERSKTRQVIVRVEPSGVMVFRLKGTTRTFDLMADAGYHAAVKQEVRAEQAAKRKGRRS
jgi:hypothetical protein